MNYFNGRRYGIPTLHRIDSNTSFLKITIHIQIWMNIDLKTIIIIINLCSDAHDNMTLETVIMINSSYFREIVNFHIKMLNHYIPFEFASKNVKS